MPRTTKAEIQHNVVTAAHNFIEASILLEDLCDDDIPSDDPDNDYMEDAELLELAGVMTLQLAMEMDGDGTRGAYNQFPKSKDWFPASLQQPDRWFRSNYRMSRDMFDHLVYILAQNQIFYSPKKRQRHIKFQLATFLIRYGQRGSPVLDAASKLGLGFGTVHLYCRRITRALRELRARHLGWLGELEKKTVLNRIEARYGFENCCGSGDGCQIRMGVAPLENPDEFLSRKKEHSTNMQATVDDECRFTSFELGWPGCVTDNKIFKYSHLWRHRHQYFKNGEYILVDKGYISSPWTVRPFDEPEIGAANAPTQQRMRQFNRRLSSVRIRVEHAFGKLKGRFPSLKEMGHHADVQEMYKVIEALLILHNICIDFGDAPESIFDFDPKDDFPLQDLTTVNLGYIAVDGDAAIPPYETDQWIREAGRRKRELIFNDLFPPL